MTELHPVIQRWFAERIGQPTSAQLRGWDAIQSGRHTLIAAPTGSGKTLAAFLIELDLLLKEALAGELPDQVRAIYVSPLKALSSDIHKNLAEPRKEIRRLAEATGLTVPRITAAVRTGDTPASERAAMLKTPPHLLITTPESLYLLLTAERSREMLRTARTVIVDEIHAVLETRRGAHLALSLERLDHVAERPLQRIGLSATQRPVETVARWLVGTDREEPVIIDEGHRRNLDLGLELPGSPLEAVMSAEVWEEVYGRLAQLIQQHRTTLVFVNTRRLAERAARHLSDRLGDEAVTAHHGSMAREARLDAEDRLKGGRLKALVATASLELGIDIGHVDLVCQLGSPRRIATFLQRVGRSGHTIHGTPKGRLFPLTRDELVESAALLAAVAAGELDRVRACALPLDVLAQQIVAEIACEEWGTDELLALIRRATPYARLDRADFDAVLEMLAHGFATRRGRRGALIHFDGVHRRIRPRRGSRLVALTSGGAIPDNADYRVILEPEGTFIGTLNEDFAIESMPGDVFQLGNMSWRMLRIERGTVRVEDAHGQPPGIPFWLGEAPARSDELSIAVSTLRQQLATRLEDRPGATDWLAAALPAVNRAAAEQIVAYLGEALRVLGALPTRETLVGERFFDESGGMQLVIHSPFGSRVNRAWGLALRKRFCRQFNFELQAAATEESLLLSLGLKHSFPLETVFQFLHSSSVQEILVQALLDAPMFATRWRWNANISLAIPRMRSGRKTPPPLQRMESDDLLAAVFPDAAACLENIPGDREIPDHPLVRQTIDDCLHEAMDIERLVELLKRIESGSIQTVARDLPEPSPLAHEILNARPYAFLDDAPLEERRAHAVYTRRAYEPSSGEELGQLDPQAIERVRQEAWPEVGNPDELHDALLTSGFLAPAELWQGHFATLVNDGRAAQVGSLWVAIERLDEIRAALSLPGSTVERGIAVQQLLRGRLDIVGPTTAVSLATSLGIEPGAAEIALAALESEGIVLRGRFTPARVETEWCERRLLARIHRYTLNRLRAEIEPVSVADFLRFLFQWQRVDPEHRVRGIEGLAAVLEQLDGFELPAGAWETDVLAQRCEEYDPLLLDTLCLTGRITWARLAAPPPSDSGGRSRPLRTTPVALFQREHADSWLTLAPDRRKAELSTYARLCFEALEQRGASFTPVVAATSGLLVTQVEQGLSELGALGLVTSDSYAGLRALITPAGKRRPVGTAVRRRRTVLFGIESAGRWSLVGNANGQGREAAVEQLARTLLRRYGVVFRRLLERESLVPPWRELLLCYRRLEARGEIRGGRFVAGMTGEQFALPEAVAQLRGVRRSERRGKLVSVSAADPLNLVGIVTPGERIPALANNRIVHEDGVPIAALVAGEIRWLVQPEDDRVAAVEQMLRRKRIGPALRAYLGMAGRGERLHQGHASGEA